MISDLPNGYYIANSAYTLTEAGLERFETQEEAEAKLTELNNPFYHVILINN